MAGNREQWMVDSYPRRLEQSRQLYEERKSFHSNFSTRRNSDGEFLWEDKWLRKQQGQEQGQRPESGDIGSSVIDPGVGTSFGGVQLSVPGVPGEFRFTSPFGPRWGRQHWGVDTAPRVPGGTDGKILAAGDGVVTAAGPANGFGQWIVIKHSDSCWTIYGHMPPRTIQVRVGDQVRRGQHIAMMGTEGQSTGIHLHFEITRNFANRRGNGPDGKPNTIDPETIIDFRGAALATTFSDVSDEHEHHEGCACGTQMHVENIGWNAELTEEGRRIDLLYSEVFPYNETRTRTGKLIHHGDRENFLIRRVGWARSTQYKEMIQLDKTAFLHAKDYDGYEGNLYSPDAASFFVNLLFKTKKPYFEVTSGFRFSNEGLLSPHEAGCAMDIRIDSLDDARKIADCAWQLGARSISIGGDLDNKTGFIHIDIAPKGESWGFDGIPLYGGPGKWEIK